MDFAIHVITLYHTFLNESPGVVVWSLFVALSWLGWEMLQDISYSTNPRVKSVDDDNDDDI